MIHEVILLAKMSHAAILIFNRTNREAFGMKFSEVCETVFLKNSLETFGLAIRKHHRLGFAMLLNGGVEHRDNCILLFSLFPTI
jgi:hypothetical protein